jgi:nitroreductase
MDFGAEEIDFYTGEGSIMRDFYEVVNSRRSIRDFENVSIEDEIIEKIISAGMKAPTNDHMRDWHFIVIKDKNTVVKLINKIPEQNCRGICICFRIPLGDEGEWAKNVLNFPEDYLMPCFLAVGKTSANSLGVAQKEYSISERIHKNVW